MLRKLSMSVVRQSRALGAATIVLCAVGAFALATAVPSVAQTGTIYVSVEPATQTAQLGGTFTVDIVAELGAEMDANGLGAYEFELVYDPDYLEVLSIADAGELTLSGRTTAELGPVQVEVGRTAFGVYSYYEAVSQPAGPTGTITLATVELTANQAGTATLDLQNARLADTQGVAWPGDGGNLSLQDGTVTITEADGTLGDVNGDGLANSTDALIILSCDVGFDTAQFCPMDCGDVNNDTFINSTDALIILSYDVGYSVPYAVEEGGCPSGVNPCPGCSP